MACYCGDCGSHQPDRSPRNPEVGPRCGECRLGTGIHNTADPLCEARKYEEPRLQRVEQPEGWSVMEDTDITPYLEEVDAIVKEAVASASAEVKRPMTPEERLLADEIVSLRERLNDEWRAGYRAGYDIGRIAEKECWPYLSE